MTTGRARVFWNLVFGVSVAFTSTTAVAQHKAESRNHLQVAATLLTEVVAAATDPRNDTYTIGKLRQMRARVVLATTQEPASFRQLGPDELNNSRIEYQGQMARIVQKIASLEEIIMSGDAVHPRDRSRDGEVRELLREIQESLQQTREKFGAE